MKKLLFIPIFGILVLISFIFWNFTLKDYLPTPLPKNYQDKKIRQKITLKDISFGQKPIFLHFFNPKCPCSRFNLDHVRRLIKNYGKKIDFKIVLQTENKNYDWQDLEKELNLGIPYLIDNEGLIAQSCGVYATPQAVLLNQQQELFYKGNYNRARYCTNPKSNYAQMAIDSLLSNKSIPIFGKSATQAYGCQLPQDSFQY